MMQLKNLQNKKPEFGISIYPNKSSKKEIIEYLELAHKYNFKRVFTNLIGLTKKEINVFKEICLIGSQDLGMSMIADIDETVLKILEINLDNLTFFKNLGIKIIRLDVKFDAFKVALLSNNKDGIQFEINASDFSGLEKEILQFEHNKTNIVASHNFFPQKYTGLSVEKFHLANINIKQCGFKISAFVSIMSGKTIDAWDDSDGAVTLEILRNMNIIDQFQYLMAQKYIDYIIVSNQYLTEQQFKDIAKLELSKIEFYGQEGVTTKEERQILYFENHKMRGDNPSDVMYRSTISRKVFANLSIVPRKTNKKFFESGDIVITNNAYGRYKGELHIIKSQIPISYKKNFVGKILFSQLPLLDLHRPSLFFRIKKGKNKIQNSLF